MYAKTEQLTTTFLLLRQSCRVSLWIDVTDCGFIRLDSHAPTNSSGHVTAGARSAHIVNTTSEMQGPRTARARSTPGGTQSDDNMATDTERRTEAWSGYATPLPTSSGLTQRAATTVIGTADISCRCLVCTGVPSSPKNRWRRCSLELNSLTPYSIRQVI